MSPSGEVEQRYGERRKPLSAGRRLSCQAEIRGDLIIDVPAESQMHRQVVRKSAEYREITLDTTIHLYYVEVQEANLDEPSGDLDSKSGAELLSFMRTAVKELGQTIVMVTHDPVSASYADEIVFLDDGLIVDEMQNPTAEAVFDKLKELGS